MLDGKGGGAASRSLSLFVMRRHTHTHTLLLHRSVTLWLFFPPPLCACVVPSSWYKMTSWASACRKGAALRRFDVFRVQHEVRRHWRALTLYSTAALCGAFSENTFLKNVKKKKNYRFFCFLIYKLFYFVLFSLYGYMNVLHILLLLHFNEMFYPCHFYYWILSLYFLYLIYCF